jgi:hypothetical protein
MVERDGGEVVIERWSSREARLLACGDTSNEVNTRHWETERIVNEAKAVKLLAERTKLPGIEREALWPPG